MKMIEPYATLDPVHVVTLAACRGISFLRGGVASAALASGADGGRADVGDGLAAVIVGRDDGDRYLIECADEVVGGADDLAEEVRSVGAVVPHLDDERRFESSEVVAPGLRDRRALEALADDPLDLGPEMLGVDVDRVAPAEIVSTGADEEARP